MNHTTRDLLEVAHEVGLDLDHGQFRGGSDGNFTGALGISTPDGLGVCGDGVYPKQEYLLMFSLVLSAWLLAGLFEADRSGNARSEQI